MLHLSILEKRAFVLCGGKIVTVNTSAQQEFKLTAEAVKEKLTSRSRVLMLNYPNNPTGAIMTYEDWLPIVELVKTHNLIVISDEVYSELTYDRTHVSIASVPGMLDRTIVINGFSKAFAMTGWRIGYACGQGELIAAMLKIHQYTTMCAPVLGQIAAMESLRNGLGEKDRMIVAYRERRDYFVKGLRERVVLSYAGGNVLRLSFHCRYRIKLRTVCTSVAKRNRSWSCSRVRVWRRRGGLCPLLLLSCS